VTSAAEIVGIAVPVVLVVFLASYYLWVYRRNRSLGTPGITSRSRLTCPNCRKTFDFDYIPGASFTAVRLGKQRYMACPLCHKWGLFDLSENRLPVTVPP
jgi:hypothetical protein